jgi:putative hydrolase of the HAD superfamily
MTSFIADNLKISNEEAFNIQKQNFIDHGTTLAGFMKTGNDKIDPDKFLEFVHDINLNSLQEDNDLRKILLLLPGKKYIFTNGTKKHAENVLKKLNLENIFQSIFGIKEANYLPKPNLETYNLFLRTYKIDPKTSIMFEDMGRNLIPAKELGMKTVLLERKLPNKNNSDQEEKYKDLWNDNYDADYIIDDIVKFLNNQYSKH